MKKLSKMLSCLAIILIMIKSDSYNIGVFGYISIGALLIMIGSLLIEFFQKNKILKSNLNK